MKKVCTSLLLLALLSFCAASKKCDMAILKQIKKVFISKYGIDNEFGNFERLNCVAYKAGLIKPLAYLTDTFFIINEYSPATGTSYGTIWNRAGLISFVSDSDKAYNPHLATDSLYNYKFFRTMNDWDKDNLKSLETAKGAFDAGEIYATRITATGNVYKIECFRFPRQFEW